MVETIIVTDLYEGAYYWLNKTEITSITCEKVNGKVTCKLTFSGPRIAELQYNFFKNNCLVNLYDFRRAYTQLNSYVFDAKRKYKQEQLSASPWVQPADAKGGADE